MKPRSVALALAVCSFVGWLGILYAGADHPPPPGFVWAVLLDLLGAVLVYIRVPAYLAWSASRRPLRVVRAAFDGTVVGVLYAAFVLALPFTGEPAAHATLGDHLLFFVALAVVGAMSATGTYLAGAVAMRLSGAQPPRLSPGAGGS